MISGSNILQDKAQEVFLFSFRDRVPVIFHWISEGLCDRSFIEEIFNIRNWRKRSTWIFLQFYKHPDLGKKIFTTWNVPKSELYLTCINFWKFMMISKHVLNLLDSQVDATICNLVSKCNFWCSCPPQKSAFEFMTNLKFSFPEIVHISPKPVFLFKFSNF